MCPKINFQGNNASINPVVIITIRLVIYATFDCFSV